MSGGKPTRIIEETQSLCPHCLETLPATIYDRDGQVYMYKICPKHGEFDVYLWPDVDNYRWFTQFAFPPVPRQPQTESTSGCPRDCGLCPRHRRHTTIAEIEVTWRCNLACPVCFMATGSVPPDPTLETIAKMFESIRHFEGQNTPVQLSGGEPTIRADLPDIIALGRQAGFNGIEINTNGLVIASDRSYLHALKEAGLSSVYLQFDGVKPEVTRTMRGADLLADKLEAIENCRIEGIPVILAATIVKGINDDELGDLITFAMSNLDTVRGLSLQTAFESGRFDVAAKGHLSVGDVLNLVAEQTDGRIAARDFWPLGCSHPLCSCATYISEDKNSYTPITRLIDEDTYRAYFDIKSPQGSVFPDMLERMHLEHNSARGLSILIMGLMDAWTIDLNRVQECSITIATADGYTIPFCAYHLTDTDGRRLYPLGYRRTATIDYS